MQSGMLDAALGGMDTDAIMQYVDASAAGHIWLRKSA